MQKEALKQLRDELSKLTGFMSPTPIKSAASEAIRFMNQKGVKYPICIPNSPIISAYASIFANSKELKNFQQLLNRLVDLIRSDIFRSDALLIITNFICSNLQSLDVKYSVKLLQYTTSAILQDFPDLFRINSFFSISLAFLAHQNPLVSTTAYASFQQMLSSLIDSINNYKDTNQINYQNAISYIQKEYKSMLSLFPNPLHVILNLIFCDLSNLSENLKPSWLIAIIQPPPNILFDLFAEIVQNYRDLFKSEHTLLTSFRLNILQDIENPNSIPYLTTYIATFLDYDEDIIPTIISQFFQKIQYNPVTYYSPIYFFHCFALNRSDAMFHYFNEYSGAMSIFVPLFCTFISYVKIPESPVSFQMKQWKLNDILADTHLYESIAIHEIAFAILASFKKSDSQIIAEFITKSVTVFVSLVTSGVRISDMSTFGVPQQALFDLAYMLNKISLMNKLDDKFETINLVFTGFNQTQRQIFLFAEKGKAWPSFLTRIVKTAPEICEDRWKFYIPAILDSGIPATFANDYSNITTIDVIQALMTKKPFPSEYITEFFIASISRFSLLWPIAEAFIDKMLQKNRFDKSVFEFYLLLMNKSFTQKTEIELSRITATFMESTMPLENKLIAMNQLKDNLSNISYEIKEGWPSLFCALHPTNFADNKELIKIGYQILNFLVPDYVLDIFVMHCVNLIFSYIQQQIDDSISLSSFELLSRISKKVENWDLILLNLSDLLVDPRTNIAEAAVSTFSQYLNTYQMSKKLSKYFLEHGISDILEHIDNSSIVLSHLLVDIADYSCRNWDRLSPNSEFINLFIPMLIERHQRSKRDIVPFYLVFYSYNTITPKIDRLLSRSISNRINGLIADLRSSISDLNEHGIEQLSQYYSDRRASSIVDDKEQNHLFEFNSLADLVTGILRQNGVKISLRNWIPILTLILQTAPSSTFPSICKSYASIPSRIIASYNMSCNHNSQDINDFKLHRKDESVESIESLSNAVASLNSCEKRTMLVDILYKIIEKLPWLVFACRKAMSVDESTPIINIFFTQIPPLTQQIDVENFVIDANEVVQYNEEPPLMLDDENKTIIFDCLSSAVSNKEMKETVLQKVVEMFPLMKVEQQQQFILSHTSDQILIHNFLKTFFDKNSSQFTYKMFHQNVVMELDAVKLFLERENNTVDDLLYFISFLKELDIPPIEYGNRIGGDEFKNEIKDCLIRIVEKRRKKGENVDSLIQTLGIQDIIENENNEEN